MCPGWARRDNIRSGVMERTFRVVDPMAPGPAVLVAKSRFHHPAHAAKWVDGVQRSVAATDGGLCVARNPG